VGGELTADRGAKEVRSAGIKTFLHQQIDAAKIDVTEVDCDLFGFGRSVVEVVKNGNVGRS
jgi:hypothetical protein